ncbi:tyrosine-type recombinase/integrase [uncultured Anaerovibrio sp.]|uniref:tyrosine-type recombinase/integrase n=1 Tax=uncultured Anaerovibrio sp. TaxID=361586 RepID=UPI002631DFF0|nr:tyrosine-type recombinase/integrase [uncultured Anaerovibrio sp.]
MHRKDFFGATKREALAKMEAFHTGLTGERMTVLPTVSEWIDIYLKQYAANRVKPRTYEKYQSSLRYVTKAFGNVSLEDLKVFDLQKFFTDLLKHGSLKGDGLSTSTVRGVRRYLITALDAAVDAELIKKNPARATKPPRNVSREMVILTKSQAKELIFKAGLVDSEFYATALPVLLKLTMHTGMRQGEVFGLTWDSFNEKAGTITVNKAIAHVVGKGAVFQEPKTATSKRTILLTSHDVEMLKAYRDWQQQYADELSEIYEWHYNLIFTTQYGYPLSPTNFSRRWFRPLLREAGIHDSFTFHQLRHYHASVLLEAGVPVKVVSERLGHASAKMTLDVYAHVIDHQQDKAVAALEEYMKD